MPAILLLFLLEQKNFFSAISKNLQKKENVKVKCFVVVLKKSV